MAPDMPTELNLDVKVITLPLDAITPYWRNPRDNEDAIAAVAESIKDYGYNQPIVVDQDHVIVIGDTRYRALRRLGQTTAKVVVTDLPADRIKALRIIDNRTHEVADWDPAALQAEILEDDLTEDLSHYFTVWELDRMTARVLEPTTPEQALPVVRETGASAPPPDQEVLVEVSCPRCGDHFATPRPAPAGEA